MEVIFEHCPLCLEDEDVFCPRDVDAQCLHCGKRYCGAHITQHLKDEHCVALDLKHCSTHTDKGGKL